MAVLTDVMEMDSVCWVKTAGTASAKLDGEARAAVLPWRHHVQTTKTMKEVRDLLFTLCELCQILHVIGMCT